MPLNVEILGQAVPRQPCFLLRNFVVLTPLFVGPPRVEVLAIPINLLPFEYRGKMILEPRQGRGVTQVEVTLFSKQLSMQQPLGVFSGQHRPIIGPGRGVGVANTLRLEP